jgi:teichuronic acid biosynthesis protein TuaE
MEVSEEKEPNYKKMLLTQRTFVYLTIIAGFIGAAFLSINLGPFHLFPYRVLLPLLWLLFLLNFLFYKGIEFSHIKVKFYFLFLVIWLLYAVLSLTWAVDKYAAIKETIFLFMAFSIIFFAVYFLSDIKHLVIFYYLWISIVVFLSFIGVWEIISGNHLGISVYAQTNIRAPTTVFHNPNDYATYLALSLPFILTFIRYRGRFLQRLLGILMLMVGLYLLMVTLSRANYLAVLMGAAFWFLILPRKSKIKVVIAIGLTFALLFAAFPGKFQDVSKTFLTQMGSLFGYESSLTEQSSLIVRLNLFKNSLVFLKKSFGFGVGAGNSMYYLKNFQVYDTRGIVNIHNWWLEVLTHYGLIIFLGYVAFYLSLLLNLYKAYGKLTNTSEKMICEALLIGLVSFFFASMSSSSLVALRPQWMFFAFALAFLNYYKVRYGEEKK